MDKFLSVYHWLSSPNGAIFFAVLWGLDNALAAIPWISSNNLFQILSKGIKWAKDKFAPAPKTE